MTNRSPQNVGFGRFFYTLVSLSGDDMRRVAHRNFEKGDCVLACVAMIAGRSYEDVHVEAKKLGLQSAEGEYFTRHKQLQKLLQRFGVDSKIRKFKSMRKVRPRSIVAVNPSRDGMYWHWVVITSSPSGVALLDPKPGKTAPIECFRGYKGVGMYVHAE